jgi:hypothetical protein
VKEVARKRGETYLESAKNYLNCGDVQNAKVTAIEGRRCGPRFLLPGGTGAVWTSWSATFRELSLPPPGVEFSFSARGWL